MADQKPPETNPTVLGKAVHAAWRDTMLSQGRNVAPERLVWENLSADDQLLDIQIGVEVARAAGVTELRQLVEVQAAQLAHRPALPGELVRHKRGGVYKVLERRLSESYLYPDTSDTQASAIIVTDQVAYGEQIVLYRNIQTLQCFCRPARLFDEPERFAHLTGRQAP